MDAGWIQVFVLMMAECVAPAGKTVCQPSQYELQFLTRKDCEMALQELVDLKSASDNVIVDRARSRCVPSARERQIYPSLDAINAALAGQDGWQAPGHGETEPKATRDTLDERLEKLKSCEETSGVAPCKIGEIIVEGASQPVEVWRRDQ